MGTPWFWATDVARNIFLHDCGTIQDSVVKMDWSSKDSLLSKLLSGSPLAIVIAFVVAVGLPVLLHAFLYRTSTKSQIIPSFLLLGPTGSGKSSLKVLLSKRVREGDDGLSETRTSQIGAVGTLNLPADVPLGSNKYRSNNDTSLEDAAKNPTRYRIIDTPGHGKLRERAFEGLADPSIRGVIFVVDSATIDEKDGAILRIASSYLHDLLLALQRRKTGKAGSKATSDIDILIAANKQDLFTALPPGSVRARLESEIEKVRYSKNRGLVTVGEEDKDDDSEALGGHGEQAFTFERLAEDYGIKVDALGGAVKGEEVGKGVRRWEEWIGGCL